MFTIAVTLRDVMLTGHVLAVVIAFGVVFAYPLLDSFLLRADPAGRTALHTLHVELARKVVTPGMTVVLLTGLYLVFRSDGPYGIDEPWVSATFAILFVLFGLTGAVLTPLDRQLAALAERDGANLGDDYRSAERKAAIFGSLALLLVVVAIFLMVAKPGA